MRTADEERGEEPRDEWPRGRSADSMETRVFTSADRPRPAAPTADPGAAPAGGADATRVFTRAPEPVREPAPAPGTENDTVHDGRLPGAHRRGGPSGGGPDGDPFDEPEPAPRRGGRRSRPRPRIRLGRIIAVVLLIAVALPPATWGWVWWTARQDERPASDAIVVLGASQYNGTPSPIFQARLQHAADLYRSGVAPMVVTVGGNQPGDNYTEGGSGRDWLVEQGIPADAVVAVETGSNTLRSLEAVSGVFDDQGWDSTVIVTDPWHSLRSRIMAEDQGMEAGTSPVRSGPAVLERKTQLWYITRETGSLWYYWLFGDSADIRDDIKDHGTDAA
ncbi:YdcF family protein [Nocardiopsis sp. CNT-189]|uniref:YdcF family protein n=1 Tax=Nocardiopsis oceanisediminis TaxID=2816862 RepID=UPI003B299031